MSCVCRSNPFNIQSSGSFHLSKPPISPFWKNLHIRATSVLYVRFQRMNPPPVPPIRHSDSFWTLTFIRSSWGLYSYSKINLFPNSSKFLSECHVLTGLHGVRIFFGLKPFAADRFLPSAVIGPVLSPPWNLHLPLWYRLVSLQDVPALVFAPHVSPLSSSGNGGIDGHGDGYSGNFNLWLVIRFLRHPSVIRATSFEYHFLYPSWIRLHSSQ